MPSAQPESSAELPRHPVRVVASRTGLSTHVLRAWERRYGVVAPTRTEGGQRLYSDADIERLALLQALTAGGAPISQLARLPIPELRRQAEAGRAAAVTTAAGPSPAEARVRALRAIEALDAAELRREFERGAVSLGVPRLLDEVVSPVLVEIGVRWRAGRMTIAQEHLATAVVRQVLGWVREMAETGDAGPVLVAATPAGQMHEGGALLVAATAAGEGWRVTYLGADLPAEEIARAARRTAARAVALSLVHPADDPTLAAEIRALRQQLPEGVALLLGGAAAAAYTVEVASSGAEMIADLARLRDTLRSLAADA
jgi:DNA-binding transcriptional MerR regulator/methylmalonyl-CoA mutase cobalamin-binding subunit